MSGTAKPERKLVGHANFKRSNPMTDKFTMKKFHHLVRQTRVLVIVINIKKK
jgi:hypothetical protein